MHAPLHQRNKSASIQSANTPRFWNALCARAGLDDLAADSRYDTVRKRAQQADDIVPRLHAALATHTASEWEAIFGDDVPCAAARRIEDMFDHPQVLEEEMVTMTEYPVIGRYGGVTRPLKFGRAPRPAPFAAPTLGQDSDAIRAELDPVAQASG
ncbi:MAG: CoA transferase [Lysobacter sp.]|nr:CoA transferase [Lysobacter sp.]